MFDAKNTKFMDSINSWLSANDPQNVPKSGRVGHSTAEVRSITSVSPDQSTNIATSAAVVLGLSDTAAIDKAMEEAIKTDREKAIEQFKKYPLLGCTTVLDMARVSSGYDPNGDMDDQNTKDKYNDYVNRIQTCPFFHLNMNERQTLNRTESSWSEAINQISSLFTGVASKDKEKISQAITNLANAVSSKSNTRQGITLYSVSAINSDEHTIEVYIYFSDISMISSSKKGSDSKQTEIKITKTNLSFDTEMWAYYAEKVYDKHYKSIEDWLDDNSTKPGNLKTNLCVGDIKPIS